MTTIRLASAYNATIFHEAFGATREALEGKGMTDIRLACANSPAERNGSLGPDVRLAVGVEGSVATMCARSVTNPHDRPSLLVSYVYLKGFQAKRPQYHFRDWVMDSGAFSAHNSGSVINLQDYIDCAKRLLAEDPQLTEVFSLDVIGDWRAGMRNCEEMWRQGVPAIPTYHVGEPTDLLVSMARDYPKIALGGAVGYRGKDKWAEQCFARVWPHKIHGLGFGGEKSIMALPWHSVDASNWELGPCKFGRWMAFGQMSVRGSAHNLKAEVEWYLRLEKRARHRWRREMAQLEALEHPSVRLAYGTLNTQRNLGFQLETADD